VGHVVLAERVAQKVVTLDGLGLKVFAIKGGLRDHSCEEKWKRNDCKVETTHTVFRILARWKAEKVRQTQIFHGYIIQHTCM